eukprot:3677255-Rhodomonas_salina.1
MSGTGIAYSAISPYGDARYWPTAYGAALTQGVWSAGGESERVGEGGEEGGEGVGGEEGESDRGAPPPPGRGGGC